MIERDGERECTGSSLMNELDRKLEIPLGLTFSFSKLLPLKAYLNMGISLDIPKVIALLCCIGCSTFKIFIAKIT